MRLDDDGSQSAPTGFLEYPPAEPAESKKYTCGRVCVRYVGGIWTHTMVATAEVDGRTPGQIVYTDRCIDRKLLDARFAVVRAYLGC